jgi:hypothetical protein
MKKSNHPDVVKTSLALPRPLWKAAHVRALDDNRDLQDVIVAALEAYLKPARKEGAR